MASDLLSRDPNLGLRYRTLSFNPIILKMTSLKHSILFYYIWTVYHPRSISNQLRRDRIFEKSVRGREYMLHV